MKIGILSLTTVLAAMTAGMAHALPAPAPADAPGELAFGEAVLLTCLSSLQAGKPVTALDARERAELRLATAQERPMAGARSDDAVVWASQTVGDRVMLSETSATRCDVSAYGLPVAETIARAFQAINLSRDGWHAVPQTPKYNPIVYQMENDIDGAHYVIHMEGSELGGVPGLRKSEIVAWVVRTDAGGAK